MAKLSPTSIRGFLLGQGKATTGPEGPQFLHFDAALKGPLFHGGFCIRIDQHEFENGPRPRRELNSITVADRTVEERRFQRRVNCSTS